jgi:hypothetical protein
MGCGGVAWAFNLDFKVDPTTGEKIDVPTDKSNSLLIIKPDKFEISVVPRTEMRAKEIIQQWRVAEQEDRESRESYSGVST